MSEPMSDERLAEIRGYIDAGVADIDVVDLFVEVKRLRAELNGAYTGAAVLREELDEAREQLDGIETRVFQRFDVAVEGDDLNAMTVTQLTDYVMAAIRKGRALDGTEGGR